EHCARALDRSLPGGSHGLPLMGTGDWNDGMNRVGAAGQGESVWVAQFLHAILGDWGALAEARGEGKRAERWRTHAVALKDAMELEPGYIKGYVPGVRENGGQYTHAAVWAAIAFASLGDGDRAGELFALLNPINHARTPAGVERYKVEPYVIAADVYAEPPHTGRGGWTWYTGSAGWMYRAGLESILGVRVRGSGVVIDPCIPRAWEGFSVALRHGGTRYDIRVENPHAVSRGVVSLEVDGVTLGGTASVALV